jgi:oligopeptide/dipeptide ABC transporter ATP-binding protein
MTSVLSVRGLRKHFVAGSASRPGGNRPTVYALNGVDLDIADGEIVALVGESGSGKTTLANCIAGFIEPSGGEVKFSGEPMFETRRRFGSTRVRQTMSRRERARHIQVIFQDPSTALDPRQRVASALHEPLTAQGLRGEQVSTHVDELCALAGIPNQVMLSYPASLNTGMRQRVVLARALTLQPKLLIADEPVSSLDVSVQGQILNLLLDLNKRLGISILFITHDLTVVRQIADRVIVMYLGLVMETARADDFFSGPLHPYSQALLASTPSLDKSSPTQVLKGEIPSGLAQPRGCPFGTRCPIAVAVCDTAVPAAVEIGEGRTVACVRRSPSQLQTEVGSNE